MFQTGKKTDASSLICARLSFSQLLLLLSYVLLESSLPAKIGDFRQVQDILARKEHDWHPQIGEETYPEMKQRAWNETSRETRRAWREIREYMVQQNLIDSTISGKDMRQILRQLLVRIEQISAQGLNAVCSQSATLYIPSVSFSERGILALVCISVSVIATPGGSVSLRSLLGDLDQHLMKEMGSQLPASPLFRNGISLHELQNAFKSLDELFLFLSGFSNVMDEDPNVESPARDGTPKMATIRQETWTYRYEARKTQEASFPLRGHTAGPKRAQEAVFGSRDTHEATGPLKRRKRSSSGTAKGEDSGAPLKGLYHLSE